jgi:hypothetical protein
MITELWICHYFQTRHGPAVSFHNLIVVRETLELISIPPYLLLISLMTIGLFQIGSTHAGNLSDVAHRVYPAPPHYNIGNHLMHFNNNKTLLDS